MLDGNDTGHSGSTPRDHLWTVAAIAVLAYIAADIAHETIGHGVGLLLAGGRSGIFTTTRLLVPRPVPNPAWRIFDLGGPAGNLALAAAAWLGLRLMPGARSALRFFLWLAMGFSLYWAFGYLLFCGVTGRGDWMALLPDGGWPGRIAFAVAGFALYRLTTRILARELRSMLGDTEGLRNHARRLAWIAWLAGGVIATAGAALDPRGPMEMLNSGALSSFAAAVGLLQVPGVLGRAAGKQSELMSAGPFVISRSWAWMAAAAATSIFFIAVLGRGIAWRL